MRFSSIFLHIIIIYSGRGNCSAVAQALNSYNTVNVILNHVAYRLSLNDVAKVYGKEGVHKLTLPNRSCVFA